MLIVGNDEQTCIGDGGNTAPNGGKRGRLMTKRRAHRRAPSATPALSLVTCRRLTGLSQGADIKPLCVYSHISPFQAN